MSIKTARANTFNTGMAAEFFVLSQLFRIGLEAYLSQGNKKAIDIRVVHSPEHAISIDVKAVRSYSSLVVNNVVAAQNHFVVFVIYNNKFEDLTKAPEVFIVPSLEVAAITKHFGDERRVMKGELAKYKDNWQVLHAEYILFEEPQIMFKLKFQHPWPNITVKRTPTKPMASPFSWALLVPSTRCAPSGAAYLGRWASVCVPTMRVSGFFA